MWRSEVEGNIKPPGPLNLALCHRSSIKGVKWASENGISIIDVSQDSRTTASARPPSIPPAPATATAVESPLLSEGDAIPALLAAALASAGGGIDDYHHLAAAAASRRGTAGYFPPLAVSVLSGLPTAGKAELLQYVRASMRPGLPGCAFVVGSEGSHGDQVLPASGYLQQRSESQCFRDPPPPLASQLDVV